MSKDVLICIEDKRARLNPMSLFYVISNAMLEVT